MTKEMAFLFGIAWDTQCSWNLESQLFGFGFWGGGGGGGGTGDLDRCTYPLQIQPTGLHDLGKLGGDDMIDVFFESR